MTNCSTCFPAKLIRVKWGGPLGDQTNRVYLPSQLFKALGLKPGTSFTFKLGGLSHPVTVAPVHCGHDFFEPIFFVSPEIAHDCQIPANILITLKADKTLNILQCGPLIGLFTLRKVNSDSEISTQEPVLFALANSAPKMYGFVFIFSPEDINWEQFLIKGFIPALDQDSEAKIWTPLTLPFPDVIYDRIPSRSIEAREEVQNAKNRLMACPGITYFNPRFLDKWETHVALQKIPEVSNFLPPTKLVESDNDINSFLQIYRAIFLKPTSGSLGRRIIKVEICSAGKYRFMYRSREKQTIEGIAVGFNQLMSMIKPIMGKRTYIVQKDLNLSKFEDCPFDIRVLAQKDMWGNWRRTKIYVRQAVPGSFISNLSDGARTQPISTVIKEIFNADFLAKDGLGEDIRQAVKKIPAALETVTNMVWAELGIDLAVDNSGKIWLIEINSKPFRALISNSGSMKTIERSLLRPLEFAKFLAGFYRHSPSLPNSEIYLHKGGNPGVYRTDSGDS